MNEMAKPDFGEPWIPIRVDNRGANPDQKRFEFSVAIGVSEDTIRSRPNLGQLRVAGVAPRVTACVNALAGIDLDHLTDAQLLALAVLRGDPGAIAPLVDKILEDCLNIMK